MTKVTILDDKSQDGKKPIQFIRQCDTDEFEKAQYKPEEYTNIELIAKDFCPHEENNDVYYDLMFAYDIERRYGTLFLGHFNDGIV